MLPILKGKVLQIASSFIAAYGLFGFGLAHFWPAPAIAKLLDTNNVNNTQITDDEASWIATLSLSTVPIASFITVFLADYFGPKNVLLLAPFPVILSWVFIILAGPVYYYYIARCLIGFSDALFYNCVFVYIAEISNQEIRGMLLSLVPIMLNLGTCVVYYFGYTLDLKIFATWSIVPSVIYILLSINIPQSPYYYLQKKNPTKARKILEQLENHKYSDSEFETFERSVRTKLEAKAKFKQLLQSKGDRNAFILIITLNAFQNLAGTLTLGFYLHFILEEIQVNVESTALIFAIVTMVASIIQLLVIDFLGRRPLLFFSFIGSGVSIIILGTVCSYQYQNLSELRQWIAVISLAIYIFFSNLGIVNLPLSLCGELLSTNMRNLGAGGVVITFGTTGCILNKIFLLVVNSFGMSVMFFVFGVFGLLGAIVVYYYLPETRQKTLLDIHAMLGNSNNPSNSFNNASTVTLPQKGFVNNVNNITDTSPNISIIDFNVTYPSMYYPTTELFDGIYTQKSLK